MGCGFDENTGRPSGATPGADHAGITDLIREPAEEHAAASPGLLIPWRKAA